MTTWTCSHTQTTAARCIRCCVEKPKWFVLRKAAGGSPAANRHLCDPCYQVYLGLGLIVGKAVEAPVFNPNSRGMPLRILGRDR